MRAGTILRRLLKPFLSMVHAKRREAVFKVVEALLKGNRVTMSALGRATAGSAKARHKIKRVDRLMGNEKLLEREHAAFCMAIASLLLRNNNQPLVLVDVSELDPIYSVLSAAVPVQGRSVTIYAEVHPRKTVDSAKVRNNFLKVLHEQVLPRGCVPIVITDANFKNPWWKEVRRLGWDFLGRREGTVQLQRRQARELKSSRSGPWTEARALYGRATRKVQDLRDWFVAKTNPLLARLVLYKEKPRGRHGWRHPRRKGSHRTSAVYKKYRTRAVEPWLLMTSLRCKAKRVVSCFSARMLIEENYRDFKSHRFGWALEDARVSSAARWQVLILFAMLAALAPMLFGLLAEQRGLHRDYQCSGSGKRRQLSHFSLGRLVINDGLTFPLHVIRAGLEQLRLLIWSHSPQSDELDSSGTAPARHANIHPLPPSSTVPTASQRRRRAS